jgi:Ca2+-binding RTX toxin-like protein
MAILTVGAGKMFSRLSDAIAASRDGDVLQVQAGTYTNDFATVNSKITIEGVGGMVKLAATIQPPNAKGILITNTDVTIRNVEFTGAAVPDANGAGIRHQGGALVVENCYFHHNQEHILTNHGASMSVTILRSEFANHNPPDGQAHSIYIGGIGKLEIRDSYFHDGTNGNLIKSRAAETIITGSRIYDNDSPVSYSIDLPNGGKSTITNNVIVQGANSPNRYIISYGTEGTPPPGSSLLVQNNVIENFGGNGYAVLNRSTVNVVFADNKLYQMTRVVDGPSTQTNNQILSAPVTLDRSAPWTAPGVVVPPPPPVETGLVLNGTDGNDVLAGAGLNDTLTGGAGDDTLTGNLGNDVLNGGTGNDTASYATSAAGVSVNLGLAGAQNTGGAGIDTLISIENVVGGSGSDVLTGSEGANTLTGNAGNDVLRGNGGNDVLNGGAGDDTMDGGAGVDTVTYIGLTQGVTVNLAVTGAQNTGGGGIDTIVGVENLSGTTRDDVLTGNDLANVLSGNSGNDILSGGNGNDTLIGGAGDDRLDGGSGNDTASYAGTTAGVIVDLTLTGAQNTGGAGFDTLISIEHLVGGSGNDTLTGNDATNVISGGVGNDVLRGGGGVDYLDGGAGNDVLIGGAGRDFLIGGAGADIFRWESLADSGGFARSCDLVWDFSRTEGDILDLSALDANAGLAGDQAFTLIGAAAFSGAAGQLRFLSVSGNTRIEADVNGDRVADFHFDILGSQTMQARDFVF